MLRPPEPQMIDALVAASQNQHIAAQIANNFDDPRGFSPWWFDAEASQQFLQGTDLNRVA